MDAEFVPLTRSKTRVAFSLASDTHITIDYSLNPTILPVIKNIPNITWNESLAKWVIPANLQAYRTAIKTLPVNTPNLQIEIDPIPNPIIQKLLVKPLRLRDILRQEQEDEEQDIEELLEEDDETVDIDTMDRWSKFVESFTYCQLKDFQKEAVKRAIERKGRLLIANEGGVGKVEEALAIASAYKNEWPILMICPSVLLLTWKEEIEKFFELDDDEVRVLPDVRADIFKPPKVKKRKADAKKTSRKKRQINERSIYNSVEEYNEDDDDDDNEDDNTEKTELKQTKFYITSYEIAARRRNQIKNAKIKMIICDGAQFMKARGNSHNKSFVEFLENHNKLILLSDIASHCLPAELFTSIKAVQPELVTTFDKFAKRYCDPKQLVVGWIYNGRSNIEELDYILEKLVWYSPRMEVMAPQLPTHIRETVVVPIKPEHMVDTEVGPELSMVEKIPLYMDMIKYANVNKPDTMTKECQDFNTTARIVLVDMKLTGLASSCLHAADLVIFNEIPLQKSRAKEIENYFKFDNRTAPLIIKYLVAPNTLDDVHWPIPESSEME
ncbi:hypothetical protein G6F37_003313 [Rhizopus arrhizus]|nr:hypothetical protein G6F38_003499 [Rhizopus arrhizus]KAG1161178.1 hypothetical protein G6F37_003313 [Rhizopus arrhizus]